MDESNKTKLEYAVDQVDTRHRSMPPIQKCHECGRTKPAGLFSGTGLCLECWKLTGNKACTPPTPRSGSVVRSPRRFRYNPYYRRPPVRRLSEAASLEANVPVESRLDQDDEGDEALDEELRTATRKAHREILIQKIDEAIAVDRERTRSANEHEIKMKALAAEKEEIARKEADAAKEKEIALREAAAALRRVIGLKRQLAQIEGTE
ncbi:MAG: hypothetical protein M1835_007324 [Candelina submexicana]|nr:MAG: hypothetical protein M1835_007324 [Candelina submexicana]